MRWLPRVIYYPLVESDPVEKLASRIACILEKDLKRLNSSKKKKTENGEAEPVPSSVPETFFKSNDENIDPSTSIADALRLDNLMLHVGNDKFQEQFEHFIPGGRGQSKLEKVKV